MTINFCDCAARFAQLDKRRSAEWEVAGSIPDRTNTQGLKITEESALPLLWHLQRLDILVFSDKTVGPVSQLFPWSDSYGT